MNREHITLGVVALACFAAVGTSATTLSSSVGTDPEDAVDPNYEVLPVESDDVAEVHDLIDAEAEGGDATVPREATEGEPAGQGLKEQGRDGESSGSIEGSSDKTGQVGAEREAPPNGIDQVDEGEGQDGGSTFSDALRGVLALIGDVVDSLLSNLIWVALLVGLLALLVQYRDLFTESTPTATDGGPGQLAGLHLSEPAADENTVYAAWDSLVRELDVPGSETVTPGQVARIASKRDYDETAIRELQTAFEAVRYGDGTVTAERREAVEDACMRLGIQLGGGGS